ncbi:permease [Herbiconiux liukaitaii]|uniref:permease n=1 Tax=Herbiconiux liukaitaii TaxID=3342799 RepID=UPI0035B95714
MSDSARIASRSPPADPEAAPPLKSPATAPTRAPATQPDRRAPLVPDGPFGALRPRSRFWRGALIGVALLAAVVAVRAATGEAGAWDLPDRLQDFLTLSISVIVESLPFVVLGIVLSIVVQHWLPPTLIVRVLPRNGVLRRVCISFIGMLLPVCECGNVPLARGLVLRGFTPAESIVFLLAAPILNPITIVTTYQAFGWEGGILVGRIVGGFLIANFMGWLFSRHPAPESILTGRFAAACRVPEPTVTGGRARAGGSVDMFVRETSTMLPALVLGAAVAGLVQVAVPREVLVQLGQNPLLSILVMMALAFVISICSNVDAFFALSLGSTFMPGAIVAFLVFGPMIDLKMIALMRTTYRRTAILQIAIVVGLATVVIGLVVNQLA